VGCYGWFGIVGCFGLFVRGCFSGLLWLVWQRVVIMGLSEGCYSGFVRVIL